MRVKISRNLIQLMHSITYQFWTWIKLIDGMFFPSLEFVDLKKNT
jgi:hypothetical protein